ncbi:hypothetical protein L6164_001440 [Bauhinia variegata]|nr:hypothetical protein L6164_001440 [Bauhinia variegata]
MAVKVMGSFVFKFVEFLVFLLDGPDTPLSELESSIVALMSGRIPEEHSRDVLCIVKLSVLSKGQSRHFFFSYCYTTTPLAKYGMERSFSSDLIFTPEQTGEDVVKESGVSLGFTVRELDAGPIIASEVFQVDGQIKEKVYFEIKSSWIIVMLLYGFDR